MAFANVALSDTFDTWRVRTNQLVISHNALEITVPSAYAMANGANTNAETRLPLAGGTISGTLNVNTSLFFAATFTTASVSDQEMDSYVVPGGAEYVITANNGTDFQTSKLIVTNDATAASMVEYALVTTGNSVASFSARVSGSNCVLNTTPKIAGTTRIKYLRVTQ
tara:strand:- start:52016 stop:52516 length:501 start_codon:yes stop_codon:yes gene_type:complete